MTQNSFDIDQYIYREYRLDPGFPMIAFLQENFKFPLEPETISWLHFHNCMEVIYCYEPRILMIENKIYSVLPESICIVPPNQMHNSKNNSFTTSIDHPECEYLCLDPQMMLHDFFTETYSFHNIFSQINEKCCYVITPDENPVICRLTRIILDEMRHQSTNTYHMVKGLVLSFWVELMRTLEIPSGSQLSKQRELTDVYPAMVYIREHYSQPIALETLAKICHMSVSAFRQNFKKNVGMLPSRYIDNIRFSRACQLLLGTELGILDIALQCGFNSLSSFNSNFIKKYGASPSNWKKTQRSIKKRIDSHSVYLPADAADWNTNSK